MIQVNAWVERSIRDEVQPYLKRDGMSISSYIRRCLMDYLDAKQIQETVIQLKDITV